MTLYQSAKQACKKTIQWFRGDAEQDTRDLQKAAEQGDKDAQKQLGCMYYQGKGVTQDYKKALHWVQMAAKNGSSEKEDRRRKS